MRSVIIVLLGLGMSAYAGVVELRDGSRIEGEIRRGQRGWEITQADGKVRSVEEADVVSIQSSTLSATQPAEAKERLDSLRKVVENMNDIGQIIGRYEQLLKTIKDSPIAGEANSDLEKWRQRQSEGMIKVGREWLSPEQIDELDARNLGLIEKAKELVAAKRMADAESFVDQVLDSDPLNPGGLYLKGLIAYRRGQIPAARKALEGLVQQLPDHGPSLNNLAVVQWRQNARSAAMTNYQRAMAASPLMVEIHNNALEALNFKGKDVQSTPAARKLAAQCQQDEPALQEKMAKEGRHRWGATWVSTAQLQQLQEQERQIKEKLAQLEQEYRRTEDSIEEIDLRIQDNRRGMVSLESASYVRDQNGKLVRTQLPNTWYDLGRENDQLEARRKREVAQLERFKKQAEDLESQFAVPPFGAPHQMIGEEATPARLRRAQSR